MANEIDSVFYHCLAARHRATKDAMGMAGRHLISLLIALTLGLGTSFALSIPPALAGEACPHLHHAALDQNHHHHHAPTPQPHRHDVAGCLCCCIAACLSVPNLAAANVLAVPFAMAGVIYFEQASALSGRLLRPDPAPPRLSALS